MICKTKTVIGFMSATDKVQRVKYFHQQLLVIRAINNYY